MKFLQFGIFAFALSLFVMSCGDAGTAEQEADAAVEQVDAAAEEAEEAVEEAAEQVDSMATEAAEAMEGEGSEEGDGKEH